MDRRVTLLLALAASALASPKDYDLSRAKALFAKFMHDYNRQYKNATDKEIHFIAFRENLKSINKFNAMSKSNETMFGINNTTDHTLAELKTKFVVKRPAPPTAT